MATTDTASRVLTNNTRRFLPVWRPELGAKVLAGFTSDVDLLPGSQEAAFCCVPTWGLGVGRELPLFDLSRLHNSSLCLAFLCWGCRTDTAGWGLANHRHSLSMVLLAGHLRSRGQGDVSRGHSPWPVHITFSLCPHKAVALWVSASWSLLKRHQLYWILAPPPDLTLT